MVRRIVSVLVGLSAIVAIIAWPTVVRRSEFSHAMAVVEALSTIHRAETQYLSQFGQYATSLTQLGPHGAGLIDRALATGRQVGFEFVLRSTEAGYAVFARPVGFGNRGGHTYYSDQSGCTHQHDGAEPATVSCPPLGDPVQGASGRA